MVAKGKRVVVAMSGGVDSSVAAAILKKAEFDVIGISMRLWTEEDEMLPHSRRCCSVDDIDDARRVCGLLEIPFYVLNFEPQFRTQVVDAFCQEYLRGRTPNPCLLCNQKIKFDLLLRKAQELGADCLATGHYARIEQNDGKYRLLKAVDSNKDQSYVLYTLAQKQLKHVLFPMGNYQKAQVRMLAQDAGLPVWSKQESQEICFITGGDYRSFLTQRGLLEQGEIVNTGGKVIGTHRGLGFYTVGQRRGLGAISPTPQYVLALDASSNRIIVGEEKELLKSELFAGDVNFVSGDSPKRPAQITAKVRYRTPEGKATLYPQGKRAGVRFEQPQRAVAPGQAAVFYSGDVVLGGGVIE